MARSAATAALLALIAVNCLVAPQATAAKRDVTGRKLQQDAGIGPFLKSVTEGLGGGLDTLLTGVGTGLNGEGFTQAAGTPVPAPAPASAAQAVTGRKLQQAAGLGPLLKSVTDGLGGGVDTLLTGVGTGLNGEGFVQAAKAPVPAPAPAKARG